jgi:hypothetical protein
MPVTINGTSGVVSPDGSAGTPAYQGSDANTGMFFPAADTIAFAEGGTEVMRIDSSGNVGIGVTPSAWDGTYKAIQIGARSMFFGIGSEANLANNAYYNSGYKYVANSAAGLYTIDANVHKWYTAASGTAGNAITFTQAMTLDSSGNLLVGKTVADDSTTGFAYRSSGYISAARNGGAPCYFNRTGTDGAVVEIANDGSTVGSISVSGSSTAYNTSSDYRLKQDIQPMQNALAKVAALKPVTYKWKVDGSDGEGFIAHELQAVVPDCVTGAKDAVDAEGKPVYQGIDTSFLAATLTAALQELRTIVDSQAARIAALEGAAQ